MQLNFLSARVPLTKTFSRAQDGSVEKSPYPLVREFTSHLENVSDIESFLAALQKHAVDGHCLLKGNLNRQLANESRAGSTNPVEPTEWVCFDLDNLSGIATPEQFITSVLPPEFHDVSYILQHSASAGVTSDTGLRAHVFFMLSKPTAPESLKLFVTALNLENQVLNNQLTLTAAGTSLRYPVDRSVNQSDKLIYIAPPTLNGIVDSLAGNRITLVKRTHGTVAINWSTTKAPAQVEQMVVDRVNELREKSGLKGKLGKHRTLQTGEVLLANPDIAVVTGAKQSRGFVYLNLNNGDSWGYYYPVDNPQYLYNFKGEPVVELAKIAPTYWAQIQDTMQQAPKVDDRAQAFVFRRHETDTTYAGVWNGVTQRFVLHPAPIKRENLTDLFAQHYQAVPDVIEVWDYQFDPTNAKVFDPKNRFCNQFEMTDLMRNAKPESTAIPPTIDRIIRSIVANDDECYSRFLNWLACIYQTRRKMGTAWVFHGVEGTGKGVLFKRILSPLFGPRHCLMKQVANFEDQFNAEMEQSLFLIMDEARIEDSKSAKRIVNRIKNMITEEDQSIRGMRANAVQVRNFTNLMFFSNDYDSLAISPTDRRFNVAPRQEKKLDMTEQDIEAISAELPVFANFLAAYKADIELARDVLNNEAKRQLREASQDALEQMCQAITDGNLDYFMQYIEEGAPPIVNLSAWSSYVSVLRSWLTNVNKESMIKRDDLLSVYMYLMAPPTQPGPHKFGRMLSHKNLVSKPVYVAEEEGTGRRYVGKWKATEKQIARWTRVLTPQKQPTEKADTVTPWNKSLSA